MLNRILTLALMLSVVVCCIFVFTEDPPELEQTGPLPILMYHDVTDEPTSDNPMVVTTEKLEGDLRWLKENGYHTILPRELTAGEPLPEKPVMITFDDGYVSNYRLLFPLLQKYNMKAVISLIGSDSEIASDDIYRVPSSCNLSWGEVALMAKSGLVEFGNHTYDLHRIAGGRKGANQKPGESVEAYHEMLSADLTKNQEKIASASGSVPLLFAWPYGAYPQDKNADTVLKDVGLKMSVNSYQHTSAVEQGNPNSLYGLGRYLRTPSFSLETLQE